MFGKRSKNGFLDIKCSYQLHLQQLQMFLQVWNQQEIQQVLGLVGYKFHWIQMTKPQLLPEYFSLSNILDQFPLPPPLLKPCYLKSKQTSKGIIPGNGRVLKAFCVYCMVKFFGFWGFAFFTNPPSPLRSPIGSVLCVPSNTLSSQCLRR